MSEQLYYVDLNNFRQGVNRRVICRVTEDIYDYEARDFAYICEILMYARLDDGWVNNDGMFTKFCSTKDHFERFFKRVEMINVGSLPEGYRFV